MYTSFIKRNMQALIEFKKDDPACQKLEAYNPIPAKGSPRYDAYLTDMRDAQKSMQTFLDGLK